MLTLIPLPIVWTVMLVDQLTEELALIYRFYEHKGVMMVGKRTHVYSCVV